MSWLDKRTDEGCLKEPLRVDEVHAHTEAVVLQIIRISLHEIYGNCRTQKGSSAWSAHATTQE